MYSTLTNDQSQQPQTGQVRSLEDRLAQVLRVNLAQLKPAAFAVQRSANFLAQSAEQSSAPNVPITHRRPHSTADQLIRTGRAPPNVSVLVVLGHLEENTLRRTGTSGV